LAFGCHSPFLAEHRGEVSCAVNDAGDVDTVGDGMVEDDVRADNERAKVLAEVVALFAEFGFVRESFQRFEELVENVVGSARVVLADVVADGIEIEVGQMSETHQAHL
jgi:hypothetical protein